MLQLCLKWLSSSQEETRLDDEDEDEDEDESEMDEFLDRG